jgi:hypothetical protein
MVTKIDASMFDAQGKEIILDADADTSITADTDDQIDIKIAGADDFQFTANKFLVQTGSNIDMNGTELILDADADTSITADTDDQIDIKIAGFDDFQFTANTFTAHSGSTIAAQALTATSLTGLTTALTVAQGGSGAATHTANNVLVGAGTSAVTSVAPSTSGNVLTSNGTVWASTAVAAGGKLLQIVAAQSTTSTTVALSAGPGSYPWATTGLTCAITPAATANKIHAIFTGAVGGVAGSIGDGNTACAIGLAGLDSGSGFSTGTAISTAAFTLIHPHTYNYIYDLGNGSGTWYWDCTLHGLTVAGTTSELTYEVYISPIYGTSAKTQWGNAAGSTSAGPGKLILMEIAA